MFSITNKQKLTEFLVAVRLLFFKSTEFPLYIYKKWSPIDLFVFLLVMSVAGIQATVELPKPAGDEEVCPGDYGLTGLWWCGRCGPG